MIKEFNITLMGRPCGLRFAPWAYTLASKSAGMPFDQMVQLLPDMHRNFEPLTHIFCGAAVNWCEFHGKEVFFKPAHIADWMCGNVSLVMSIGSDFLDLINAETQAGRKLLHSDN